ncbi:MAG: altronate dehydratase family protein, partial [Chitinophagaceae bacterium]|nr:altronate dehydratase family protein [Chitinophagaceae bacterium]
MLIKDELRMNKWLQIHPDDNVLVALTDLAAGTEVMHGSRRLVLATPVKAKHKFALQALAVGHAVYMYGVLVGKALHPIAEGEAITTTNLQHAAGSFGLGQRKTQWQPPDTSRFAGRTFMGYHRPDGKVGTANYWVVIPMVFCENRNVATLQYALTDLLGYGQPQLYQQKADSLLQALAMALQPAGSVPASQRVFPQVDGVKFLMHDMGCGGTRADAEALCGLLAGYITHPNVAGATILSLGCQHAQVALLEKEIARRDPQFAKPLIVLEQQQE